MASADIKNCVEMFAGTARLPSAFREVGLYIGPAFELELGPEFDLNNKDVISLIESLIRQRIFVPSLWYSVHFLEHLY